MDEKYIGTHLRAVARNARRGPDCLDDYELASLLAASVGTEMRGKLEEHLSECSYCLERVAGLVSPGSETENTEVPEPTLHRARELVRPLHGAGYLARWASAAVIVLALGLLYVNRAEFSGNNPAATSNPDALRQSRSLGDHNVRPRILAPSPGSHLSARGGTIDWTEVNGSLYYDVLVLSLDGEIISESRVTQPHWDVPAGLLQAGADYYVRVDAFLAEATRLSSKHVLFSVERS